MLREIEDRVESSYRYFSENEAYSQEIINKGNSFENFMIIVSFLSILFACGMGMLQICLLYTSPSPRDLSTSRMPSSA